MLGAGRSFSSIAAETVAQTVLLSALVETGAVKKMPKQVSGTPGKGQVTAKMAKSKIKQLTGTFLAQNETKKITEANNRSVKVSVLTDGAWERSPGRFELRNDGRFWATKSPGTSISAVKAWGRTYVLQRSVGGVGTYYSYIARGQKVRSGGELSPAWPARVGKKWLLANENPESLSWSLLGPPAVDVGSIPGLSGYLLASGAIANIVPFDATTGDTVGSMFLEIPLGFGRDLLDVEFSMQDGDEFMSFDSSVLRPDATVPGLASGSNAVTIGSQGLVQWYRVPAASSLTISGQSDWKLFDENLTLIDSGGAAAATKQAPAGAYLAVFGPAGSAATVEVN